MGRNWYLWALPAAAVLSYAVLAGVLGPMISAGAGGLLPFDLRWQGYDAAAARAFLAALSPEALWLYQVPVRVNDTLFPILFSVVLALPLRHWAPIWCLPAAAYGFVDLAENWAVARLLNTGPLVTEDAIRLASALTQAKFALVAVAMIVALWGLWRTWRR